MTAFIVTALAIPVFGIWFWKKGIVLLAERNASKELEHILFPEGKVEKVSILESLQTITKGKYTNDLLLDYFLKIKGIQVINMYDPVNFWTRKFLMSPTKLKLNYFEQVKFYKTFLNYSEASARIIHSGNGDNYNYSMRMR